MQVQPEHTIIWVSDTDFRVLLRQVNGFCQISTRPVIFDLGGHEIHCVSGEKQLYLTGSNVTLRNGTIHLGTSPSERFNLFVDGRNVNFDHVTIKGAERGLSVRPGSSVTMRECEVQDAMWGLVVGSVPGADPANGTAPGTRASLAAHNVKISGFHRIGLDLQPAADVQLTNCVISGGMGNPALVQPFVGMYVSGKLNAKGLVCTGNAQQGLRCFAGGSVVLEGCTFDSCPDAEMELEVLDAGSTVQLCYCMLSMEPTKHKGGKAFNRTLVSFIQSEVLVVL